MTTSYFRKLMTLIAIISLTGFLGVAIFANPSQGMPFVVAFLLSLFVFIFSFYSVVAFKIKKRISNNEIGSRAMKSSARQGLILAAFFVLTLLLAIIRLLIWWDVLLLAFSLILIELYFTSDKAGVS